MMTIVLSIGVFIALVWLIRACIGYSPLKDHCPQCDYLIFHECVRCPECGTELDRTNGSARRRPRRQIITLLFAILLLGTADVAVSVKRSWVVHLPTDWLVRICPLEFERSDTIGAWLDDELLERSWQRCELSRAQDEVLWMRIVNRAIQDGTLFRCRPTWPHGMPVHLQLDPQWSIVTTHAVRLVVKDEAGVVLVERRFSGAEDGGRGYSPPEERNRFGRFSVPAEAVKDGRLSMIVEIHQSLSIWDLVHAEVDRVPPEEDRPVRKCIARVPIRLTDSADEMLTGIDSESATNFLQEYLRASLYADAGFLEVSLPQRENPTHAIGLRLEAMWDDERIGHSRCTVFSNDGTIYIPFVFEGGFNRSRLTQEASSTKLRLRVISDEEMAWRDFDKATYWAGSIVTNCELK